MSSVCSTTLHACLQDWTALHCTQEPMHQHDVHGSVKSRVATQSTIYIAKDAQGISQFVCRAA